MTSNTPNLLLENLMVETSLKLPLSTRRRRHIHRSLSATQDNEVFLRRDGRAVQRRIADVRLHDLEIRGVDELGRLVFRCRDEICSIGRPLQVRDQHVHIVHLSVVQLLSGLSSVSITAQSVSVEIDRMIVYMYLSVILRNSAILMTRNNILRHKAESRNRRLRLLASDRQGPLIRLLSLDIEVDIEDDDRAQEPHALLRHSQQLGAVLRELDALDRRIEVPCLESLAGPHVPEHDRVVCRAAGDHRAGWVDVHGPDGALVAMIGP